MLVLDIFLAGYTWHLYIYNLSKGPGPPSSFSYCIQNDAHYFVSFGKGLVTFSQRNSD